MSVIKDCKELLKMVIEFLRKKGYTNEELSGVMDEAQNFLKSVNINKDIKSTLNNIIDDEQKNIDKK